MVRALILVFLAACDGPAAEVWIAPDGSDDNAGTRESPFATLARARDAIRDEGPNHPQMTVYLRGGRYILDEPFGLDDRDLDIDFVAAPGEHPTISGGRVVTGWRSDGDRMIASASVATSRQLWIDGVRQPRARGELPALVPSGELDNIAGGAGYTAAAFPAIADPSSAELGYFLTWQHKICPVRSITRGSEVRIDMKQPCFFLITHHVRAAELPAYIENAPELIDEPGEWSITHGEIVVQPPAGVDLETAETIVPALEQLVVIRGTHDIAFHGITFAEASWLRPSTYGHPDVQANFVSDARDPARLFWRDGDYVNIHDEYWKSPGAVVIDASHAITFERCTFTRLGGAGLDLEHGASDNVIRGNRFFDISGNGIQVGDVLAADHHPSSEAQVVRGNQITNNVVRDIGVQYEDSVGIFVGYTDGTVIANNELSRLPYTAISVGWGWGETDAGGGAYAQPFFYDTPTTSANNQIVHNEIHDIMRSRSDGAGIYTLGNQPGTVISGNRVHAAAAFPGGIYLDEGSGFIEVTGNSVFDVSEPYFPHNDAQGRDATCSVHDNYFGEDVDVGAGLEAAYRDLLQ